MTGTGKLKVSPCRLFRRRSGSLWEWRVGRGRGLHPARWMGGDLEGRHDLHSEVRSGVQVSSDFSMNDHHRRRRWKNYRPGECSRPLVPVQNGVWTAKKRLVAVRRTNMRTTFFHCISPPQGLERECQGQPSPLRVALSEGSRPSNTVPSLNGTSPCDWKALGILDTRGADEGRSLPGRARRTRFSPRKVIGEGHLTPLDPI